MDDVGTGEIAAVGPNHEAACAETESAAMCHQVARQSWHMGRLKGSFRRRVSGIGFGGEGLGFFGGFLIFLIVIFVYLFIFFFRWIGALFIRGFGRVI